jgi:hypothetical protein
MDTLKQVQNDLLGPSKPSAPVDPALKTRFIAAVCKVAMENPGHVPDLQSPNPSPSVRELKQLVNELTEKNGSVDQVADLMKEAIATCGK